MGTKMGANHHGDGDSTGDWKVLGNGAEVKKQDPVENDCIFAWQKFRNFEEFTFLDIIKPQNKSMTDGDNDQLANADNFLSEFERRAFEAMSAGCTYSNNVLAFKLFEKCPIRERTDFEQFLCSLPGDIFSSQSPPDAAPTSESLLSLVKAYVKNVLTNDDILALDAAKNIKVDDTDGEITDVNLDTTLPDDSQLPDELPDSYFQLFDSEYSSQEDGTTSQTATGKNDLSFVGGDEDSNAVVVPVTFADLDLGLKQRSEELDEGGPADAPETGKRRLPCELCHKVFSSTVRLSRHMRLIHETDGLKGERRHVCDKCNRQFKFSKNLKDHIKNVHDGVRYPCDVCGKSMTTRFHLKEHKRMIHEGQRYLCKKCPKQYSAKSNLLRHEKEVHAKEKKDETELCDKCGHKAKNKTALKQHKRKVHDYKNFFSCPSPNCNYAGKDNAELKAHIIIKHEGKKLPCNKCDYEAPTLSSLYRHRAISHRPGEEKGDGKNVCDTCGYVAGSSFQLKYHQQGVHEKRFKVSCSQCSYVASNSTVLKIHVLSKHQGVKFPCDQCDFVAPHPKSLKRHKDIHHDMKRYYCDQCDYMAKDKQLVTIHKQTKHECIQFACDMCEMKFATQPSLKKHKNAKHVFL